MIGGIGPGGVRGLVQLDRHSRTIRHKCSNGYLGKFRDRHPINSAREIKAVSAWGADTFDNDTAYDWAGDFVEQDRLAFVDETLDETLSAGRANLDSDLACNALAACEIIARLQGRWGKRDAYSEDIDRWVLDHPQQPPEELIRKALLAIDRITGDQSELVKLWDDTGDNE